MGMTQLNSFTEQIGESRFMQSRASQFQVVMATGVAISLRGFGCVDTG